MESMIVIVHVLAAVGITGLVLLQHGKGADMGASFGSGASQTIFGSGGSGNVLTKSTSWLAVIFFMTSLGLALIARQNASQGVDTDALIQNLDQLETGIPAVSSQDIPVAPVTDGTDTETVLETEAETDVPQIPVLEPVATEAALNQSAEEVATEVEEAVDAATDAVTTEQ